MTLSQRLRRLDERAGVDRYNYKTPRARIPFALALQVTALVVIITASVIEDGLSLSALALAPLAGATGLLIGFLRETRESVSTR